jgi:two-component system chemotaxis response regulator CheB
MLNDGASGLADLKRCGGVTVVQNPPDADESEMPRTALLASDIDYRAPASDLAALLGRPRAGRARPGRSSPSSGRAGSGDCYGAAVGYSTHRRDRGSRPVSCPGYEGTLSQVRRSPLRFRCQVGHGYTAEALAYEQEGSVDEAVRIALKVMGERVV